MDSQHRFGFSLFLLISTLILLSSSNCAGPSSIKISTPTNPVIQPVEKFQSTPTAYQSRTSTPTPTTIFTVTTAVSITIPPPETPVPDTPLPTPDLITPPPTNGPVLTYTSSSPDGVWIAEDRWDQDTGHETFKIVNVDNSKSWTLLDRFSTLGDYQPQLLSWSKDSRHFYFRYITAAEAGEGKCEPFGIKGSLQLLRIDVENGQVTRIPLPEGTEHSISPDETMLAYIKSGEPLQLVIRNLTTGKERTIPLTIPSLQTEKLVAGGIVWSPDGNQLVLTVAKNTFCDGSTFMSTLVRIDLENPTITELISGDLRLITAKLWPVAERILVREWNGSTWWVDAQTGQTVWNRVIWKRPNGRSNVCSGN